jgi:ribosomal protein S18 acetylase RimI-like enzyme
MSSARIELRSARPEETEAIASLVNDAYGRTPTESGWTSEDDILEGPRVQAADLEAMIDEEDDRLLVAESDDGEDLVGCVHLQSTDGGGVELGLFSVRPHRQNGGLGQQMLAAAEEAAIREFGAERIVLEVITERTELLDWYDRRGYERTGETKTFEPEEPQRSLVGELAFEVLEKRME